MKITLEFEDDDMYSANIYMKAMDYYNVLFELQNNFHRRFENLDHKSDDFIEGVNYVLEKLTKELSL